MTKIQKVKRVKLQREAGFLYFVDKEGDISKAVMGRGSKIKKGSKKVLSNLHIKKEPGFLYFIDKQGDVSRVEMKRKVK